MATELLYITVKITIKIFLIRKQLVLIKETFIEILEFPFTIYQHFTNNTSKINEMVICTYMIGNVIETYRQLTYLSR